MNNTQSVFDTFNDKKSELKSVFDIAVRALGRLCLQTEEKSCFEDARTMERETFKVLVVGEFKRGKSTFINALLGEKVLPSYARPCTAIINEVKYGDAKRAFLYFRKGEDINTSRMPKDVKEYFRAHASDKPIPPLEIPVDRIEEFVVIERGFDQEESVSTTPYEKVEMFWPLQLCRNNVEIIDSPGLNEHSLRTKVTTEYVPFVDAVIFVTACDVLAGASEIDAIRNDIISRGHEDIFFVCNRFDLIDESDREDIIYRARESFGRITKLGDDGLHFLSAKQALNIKIAAKENGDSSVDLSESGFDVLEESLAKFLVFNRGRLKLLRPANALKNRLQNVIYKVVPMQIGMLGADVKELSRRYEQEKPRLEDAKKRQLLVREKMTLSIEGIKEYVRCELRRFMMDFARKIPDLLKSYQPESRITFLSTSSTRKQCEKLSKELTEYLDSQIISSQETWGRDVLLPNVSKKIEAILDAVQIDFDDFMKTIANIRTNLSGIDIASNQNNASGLERGIASAVGTWLLSPGAIMQAGQEGFKGLLKAIIPQLGVAIGLGALGVVNPFVFFGALFAAGGIQALISNTNVEKVIKKQIGEAIERRLIDGAEDNAYAAAAKIEGLVSSVTNKINAQMENEISSLEECVMDILKRKQEHETADRKRVEEIQGQKAILEQAVSRLDTLIDSL